MVYLSLYDSSGDQASVEYRKKHYTDAHAVMLCCPVNCRISFDRIKDWIHEVKGEREDLPIGLVITKKDLYEEMLPTLIEAEEFK